MAKTELYMQSHSQQQTVSPKKAKQAVSEPKLVAGQEVVGREISVFQGSIKNPEWWDGKVVEFKPESAEHLVRYHREHRSAQWLQLSGQPFQWKGNPPSSSAPNPTVKGIKLNDSILGRKVKVFWPTMCKWYLGCIKEYDPHAGRHTIKYKDGEVKDYALRNEAVLWLDDFDTKVACSSPRSGGHSTGSRGQSPDTRLLVKRQSRSTGPTSGASSGKHRHQQHSTTAETSHRASQSDPKSGTTSVAAEADTAGPQTDRAQTDNRARGGAEPSAAADRDCHSGTFAAASGNADTDAEDGYASQHSQRQHPTGEEEQTEDHVPLHGPNPGHKPSRMATLRQGRARDWTRLAGESKGGRRSGTPKGGEGRGVLDEPGAGDAIIGARVGIFWEDDETFYKGRLAGFDGYHKRSKVCYDDGQEEWISLSKERFRWFTPRGCTSKHYNPRMKNVMLQLAAVDLPAGPAALPPSSTPTQILVPEAGGRAGGPHADSASTRQPGVATAVPQAAAAVGWGLSVYSQAEEAWVMGEVLSWSSRQGQHHVLYEDGEDEWLKLPKEHVRWHSPSCTIAETAGLQKGRRVPQGLAAVGWRIGVYWRDDQKFYMGEVAGYNDEDDLYEMNYDDNEKEDICLSEQPIKWLLPPGLSTTGEAPETHARPKRATSSLDSHTKVKRQPSSRRYAQDRGLEKQKSRLGLSRRSTAIQKMTAVPLKPGLMIPILPHASASPAISATQDPSSPSATAAAMPVAIPATSAATAGVAPGVATSSHMAVAARIPPPARLGSSAAPHIDRIIANGSRRAPHLSGTRVKIYCSQGGRGIKSRRPLCAPGLDNSSSRRVRQKVEALDLMIWRCECARKVITKGAPIPVSTLSGPDRPKPLAQPQSFPVAGLIANQVAARLGVSQSVSSVSQLPPMTSLGGNQATAAGQLLAYTSQTGQGPDHLPASSQHEAQSQHGRQCSPDPVELIHQLPSSSPMLAQDDIMLLTHADPQTSNSQQQNRADRWSPSPSQGNSVLPPVTAACGVTHQSSPRVTSRSPGSSSLPPNPSPNPVTSRHSSPASASLAGLIPSTTAVTVPSPHSQPPYSVISAARAATVSDHTVPVVTCQDAPHISLPPAPLLHSTGEQDVSACVLAAQVGTSEEQQQELLPKLPMLSRALRMQDSVGTPDTPDSEQQEHHAALNRERSSFSKTASVSGQQHIPAAALLQRKEIMSTSGLLDLAMSDALPAGDSEPDMFAAFFADTGAFDKSDLAVSLPVHDASEKHNIP